MSILIMKRINSHHCHPFADLPREWTHDGFVSVQGDGDQGEDRRVHADVLRVRKKFDSLTDV